MRKTKNLQKVWSITQCQFLICWRSNYAANSYMTNAFLLRKAWNWLKKWSVTKNTTHLLTTVNTLQGIWRQEKKESKQVENACVGVFNLLYTTVLKFLQVGPAETSLASTVAEILVDELVHKCAPYVTLSLVIGAECIAAIVVYLIIYMFKIRKLKKELDDHEISQDNFEDLRTIVRYKLSGAALGSLIGLLVASPAGVFGFKGIALAACFASVICGLIFSVILKNVAFRVVRRRNENRWKTRKEDPLKTKHWKRFKTSLLENDCSLAYYCNHDKCMPLKQHVA